MIHGRNRFPSREVTSIKEGKSYVDAGQCNISSFRWWDKSIRYLRPYTIVTDQFETPTPDESFVDMPHVYCVAANQIITEVHTNILPQLLNGSRVNIITYGTGVSCAVPLYDFLRRNYLATVKVRCFDPVHVIFGAKISKYPLPSVEMWYVVGFEQIDRSFGWDAKYQPLAQLVGLRSLSRLADVLEAYIPKPPTEATVTAVEAASRPACDLKDEESPTDPSEKSDSTNVRVETVSLVYRRKSPSPDNTRSE